MGSGMLWAAIGGGAKAYDQVLDNRAREESDERKRQQSFADRRESMLQEMKLKSQMAQEEEDRVSGVLNKIDERGTAIGNERVARELTQAGNSVPSRGEYANDAVTPEMIAEMPPAARAVYEKEMGLTDDSSLQIARDRVAASSEVGAPQAIRKGLLDTVKQEQLAEHKASEQARLERKAEQDAELSREREDRRDARESNKLAAQLEAAERRSDRRAGPVEEREKTALFKDIYAKAITTAPRSEDYKRKPPEKYQEAMDTWYKTDEGKVAKRALALLNQRLDGAEASQASRTQSATPAEAKTPWVGGSEKGEQIRVITEELDKARAQGDKQTAQALERELARLGAPAKSTPAPEPKKPAVSDNGKYKLNETRVVSSGPHKGKTVVFDGKGWKLK